MELIEKALSGLFEIRSAPLVDERGHLDRLFDSELFERSGLNTHWEQVSASYTKMRHTLRGMHVQVAPRAEEKLVVPLSGETLWVAVDLRPRSRSFGHWEAIVLSPERQNRMYARKGFGHGCLSLSDDCTLILYASTRFSPEHGAGIRWDDPKLSIDWGIGGEQPLVSSEHSNYPSFNEFQRRFGSINNEHGGTES